MPGYGATTFLPTQPHYGANPLANRSWSTQQTDYMREFPDALNSWYLNQNPQQDVGARYHGFLQQWLGDQLTAYQGNQLVEPDQTYADYLGGQNPWGSYESQSIAPTLSRAQRWTMGPRQIRR